MWEWVPQVNYRLNSISFLSVFNGWPLIANCPPGLVLWERVKRKGTSNCPSRHCLQHSLIYLLSLFVPSTPHHPKAFHFPSNGLLSSPCIITQSTFAALRRVSFRLAFLVTKPEHIVPAEDKTYFYIEWQNVICINVLSLFHILLFGVLFGVAILTSCWKMGVISQERGET